MFVHLPTTSTLSSEEYQDTIKTKMTLHLFLSSPGPLIFFFEEQGRGGGKGHLTVFFSEFVHSAGLVSF